MSPRGGPRENAGRPTLPPGVKREPHTIWLNAGEVVIAKRLGRDNVARGVRVALERAQEGE